MYLSPPITYYTSKSYPTARMFPENVAFKSIYGQTQPKIDNEEDQFQQYYQEYKQEQIDARNNNKQNKQPTFCNQLNDQDIRLIGYALQEEIQYRKEISQLAKKLRSMDPNLLQLFQMFVTDSAYKIDKFRFIEIVQSYEDDIKVCDVELLFKQLNNWKKGESITYSQFCYLITKYCKYEQMGDVNDLKYKQGLAPQIQIDYMMRIIRMNLQMLSTLEYMRQRVEKSMCNLSQLFEYIDEDKNGLIKAFELSKFLEKVNYLVTAEESCMILNDIDDRGQINIQQFIQYYKPKSQAIYL